MKARIFEATIGEAEWLFLGICGYCGRQRSPRELPLNIHGRTNELSRLEVMRTFDAL
jgi:hypothetical protein